MCWFLEGMFVVCTGLFWNDRLAENVKVKQKVFASASENNQIVLALTVRKYVFSLF